MFTSVARDSAASIASGAPISQVIAQQAPQVLQAFTMMGFGIGKITKKFAEMATTPFTGAGSKAGGAFLSSLRGGLAKMPLMMAGLAAASVAAIIASFYIFEARVKSLTAKLTGAGMDFNLPILAKLDPIADAWRKINSEVRKAAENYDSVTEAAKRLADATKDQFDHADRMNELEKERLLNAAHTPEQRQAIEKQFSDRQLENNKRRRAAELDNQKKEADALRKEAESKLKQATDPNGLGNVQSEKAAQIQEDKLRSQLAASEEKVKQNKLDEKDDPNPDQETLGDVIRRPETAAIAEQRAQDQAELNTRRNNLKEFLNRKTEADELRKRKQELIDGSAKSAAAATELDKKIADTEKNNRTKDSREAAEAAARLAVGGTSKQNASSGSPNVTDRQRINGMAVGNAPLVDIGRQQLRALQALVAQGKNSGDINIPFGGRK